MKSKNLITTSLVTILALHGFSQDYKNAKLPIGQRVRLLLSKMTVDEKVAELRSIWAASPKIGDKFFANQRQVDSLLGHGVSMVNPDFDNTLEQSISNRNRTQEYLRTKTRLGIPTIFLDEAHHGLLAMQADVFPTSIGLACSWDTALTRKIYSCVAMQASSRGTNMVLAPVVDVTRDPRWGRTGETFGEDPFLNGMMGSAVVKGLQGSDDGRIMLGHVAATLKHFTGHGQSEAGVNQAPADYPERVLRAFHMEPFRLIIEQAKPAAIMPAYVEIDGVPCHANHWLLTDVLRKEWNYNGVLVSDWWAIDQLFNKHRVAKDRTEAALQAFKAGVTADLPYGNNYAKLIELVQENRITGKELDEAVSYVLTLKFKLGLFDNKKQISLSAANSRINQPEGRALALKAAEESMVLLKNGNHILPIKPGQYKTIAVIGPMAKTNYTGDYSGVAVRNVSMFNGIQGIIDEINRKTGKKENSQTKLLYAKGVDLSTNGDTISLNNFQYTGRIKAQDKTVNQRKIDSAVEIAKQADIVILALGENEQYSREAGTPDHFGDQSTLDLPAQQNDLVKAVIETGKPVIVYLNHGRPLSIPYIKEKAGAILDGWFTGEEAGTAAANILFGKTNPSGKLTISIPGTVGQIPVYYNHKPSAHFFEYVQESNGPLYPFGYGLSYTTFKYDHLVITAENDLKVTVTNTGGMDGTEVVQLYTHPKVASVTQPVKALKAFQRISLKAGESKTVTFTITKDLLAYYAKGNTRKAEPGSYELMVGPNSEEVQKINYLIQ